MLEAIILDNTEQIIASRGIITLSTSPVCLMSDVNTGSVANQVYNALASSVNINAPTLNAPNASWSSSANNVALFSRGYSTDSTIGIDLTTNAVWIDSTQAFSSLNEDASGVIWGVSYASGLFKRVSQSGWSLVLSDTAMGAIGQWTNGQLYYVSSSGTFFTLSNGSATVSANPSPNPWLTHYTVSSAVVVPGAIPSNNDTVRLNILPGEIGYFSELTNAPQLVYPPQSASEVNVPRIWGLANYAANVATPLCLIPPESIDVMASCFANFTSPTYSWTAEIYAQMQIFRMNDTYSLITLSCAGTNTTTPALPKTALAILNKTTGVIQHITSFSLPGGTGGATGGALILAASFVSGVLTIFYSDSITSYTNSNTTPTTQYRINKKTFTLNLTF